MRIWKKLVVPMAMLSIAGVADARVARALRVDKVITGQIQSINGADITIVPARASKEGTGVKETIHTTIKTTITVDGVAGKSVTDLSAGQKVKIVEAGGSATTVMVTTKHHKHKKN